MPNIEVVWERIKAHIGQQFWQIRGGEFTYTVEHGTVKPNRTHRRIPKSDFVGALKLVPLKNTVPVQHLQGPSYIYAILMDERISQGDW